MKKVRKKVFLFRFIIYMFATLAVKLYCNYVIVNLVDDCNNDGYENSTHNAFISAYKKLPPVGKAACALPPQLIY